MERELSEKRAEDRKKMSVILEKLILECGSSSTRDEDHSCAGPQGIALKVTAPGGLQVTIEINGKSVQPDIHVLSWHTSPRENRTINDKTFGGNVNRVHFQKATYVAYGFDSLCEQLKSALLMCKDGSAYLP